MGRCQDQIHAGGSESGSDAAMTGLHLNAIAFLFLFLGCVSSSSWCTGFSCCGAQVLECKGSVVVVCGLSCPHGMWDLSSLTRNRTCVPFITRQILKHCITRKVLSTAFLSVSSGQVTEKPLGASVSSSVNGLTIPPNSRVIIMRMTSS